MSAERRIAYDGQPYTHQEFLDFYGDATVQAYWEAAEVHNTMDAGALQPGAEATPPPDAEAPQPAAIPQPRISINKMPQLQADAAPWFPSWADCEFLREALPAQQAALVANGFYFRVASSPREAMNLAYKLYDHLPLRAEAFADCHLFEAEALAVVAEKVNWVQDTNRPRWLRVDFFCYMPLAK